MKPKRLGLLLMTGLVVGSTFAVGFGGRKTVQADSLSLSPRADTYVNKSAPNRNYSSGTRLYMSSGTYRTLLRFDLSSIPAGSVISSVTLSLKAASSPAAGVVQVHSAPSGWTVSSVTWNNQPSWSSSVLARSTTTPVNGQFTRISLPVGSVTAGGEVDWGLDYSASSNVQFVSSEGPTVANRPSLVVNYTAPSSGSTAPIVNTGNASSVTGNSATLNGTVNPGGDATACRFDYGTSTSYGNSTPSQSFADGTATVSVSANVSALKPGTNYSFRLVCSNGNGTTEGNAAGFVTDTASQDNTVTKVLIIIEENHGYTQMMTGMPYLDQLANKYGYASNYKAITHPSLPNYLAISGGSTQGVTKDCNAGSCPIKNQQSVFDQAVSAGKTAKVYAENMTSNCQTSDGNLYAQRHTGWPYYTATANRANCKLYDVPAGTDTSGHFMSDVKNGSLPNVGWLIPNLCNDAHNSGCTLTTADNWLSKWLPPVLTSSDWLSGHLAIVVTADEDQGTAANHIPFIVLSPALSGKVTGTALNHYSLTRFQEDVAGVGYLNNAASAPDLAAAFGLKTN